MFEIVQACSKCSVVKTKPSDNLADGICQECTVRTIAVRRFAESNVPVEYWNLSMKDFRGEPRLKQYYDAIVADLPGAYRRGTSLCFAGMHGTGKTTTVTNIIKDASLKGYHCLYTTLSDIVSVLLSHDIEDKSIARKELISVDFLVIDEFDTRFMQSENASDLFGRTLESIFRTRSQNCLPTFLCTNSPNIVEAFSGPIKASLESLMKGYVKNVIAVGDDFRKTQKK